MVPYSVCYRDESIGLPPNNQVSFIVSLVYNSLNLIIVFTVSLAGEAVNKISTIEA